MKDEIESLISKNEKILWNGVPNKFCYIWQGFGIMIPFAILWLCIDVGVIYTLFSSKAFAKMPGGMYLFFIPFFAIHLFPVWATIGKYVKNKFEYKNVRYAITDKRVIIRDGLIGIDYKSIDFAEIDAININVNILERILKVGTINCKVDTDNYSLKSITNYLEVYKMLQKSSFDVKTDISYPNAKRPKNNPGYNTDYDPNNDK